MIHINSPRFQVITELPDPLSLFFRPGRSDHTTVNQAVSESRLGFSGGVFEPSHTSFQKEVIANMAERSLRTVLDPLMLELSTVSGLTPPRRDLKWADSMPHQHMQFNAKKVDRSSRLIAECVKENNFDSVLAPTHYLAKGANDPWFLIDRRLTSQLRQQLNSVGAAGASIYYPLALPTSVFFDPVQRRGLKASLETLNVNGIWLRVSPFGANNGGPSLQNYIIACRDFHSLKIPIVAEKAGTLGLALLAFGAVTGLESGISSGEQFNFARLNIAPKIKRKPFAPRPRVYLQSLGIFVSRDDAAKLFEDLKFRAYACSDSDCCQKGFKSTLSDPRRHFANCRMEEIAELSAMPATLRPSGYLQQMLRPADEYLGRFLANLGNKYEFLQKALAIKSRRLHGCRKTLTAMQSSYPMQSVCNPFPRKIVNIEATA
ncbi:MAG: hypothetical protein QOG67_259 [Verrucomicrobiota bacterium]